MAHDGGVTSGRRVEVLEGGSGPSRWQRGWSAVPPRRRRALVTATAAAVAAVVAVTGGLQAQAWRVERDQREQIRLALAVGVWSSSSTPRGGQVVYFLSVRNAGREALDLTSVRASSDELEVRARDGDARRMDAGSEIRVPLSVLLTCSPSAPGTVVRTDVQADVGVRRADGRLAERRIDLAQAGLVLDVADTLCSVRPGLSGYELSGPILR